MRPNKRKAIANTLFAIIFMLMFKGCTLLPKPSAPEPQAEPPPLTEPLTEMTSIIPALKEPVPPEPKPDFYMHTVQWPGETLSVIAQWYTGKHQNWRSIAKANPHLNPKMMLIGDKILIPEELLETSEPMPRKYLNVSMRKNNIHSSPKAMSQIKSGEIELFAPQDIDREAAELDEIELFKPVE